MSEGLKVTIYANSDFSTCPHAIEARLIDHGREDYAQYNGAPFVKYTPKGKRTTRMIRKGFRPFILIVEGWNHPSPPDMFAQSTTQNGMTCKSSKYLSHDARYIEDFNTWYTEHMQAAQVIADYREVTQ